MGGKSPSIPSVKVPDAPEAPAPAVAQPVPQQSDTSVQRSRENERLRRARASAANNTLVTGGAGVTTAAPTASKSLFGQ